MEQDKGYITREFTVWCGLCAEWEQESARTQAQAIERFKHRGWKLTSKNGWICSKHTGEQPEKPVVVVDGSCKKCRKVPSMIGQDICYVCKKDYR